MRKISIIIPTWKHLECLIPCCQSIIENTDLSNGEVLVVANGCGDDGTREYVESLGEPFKLIWMEEQGGYVKPVNEGIKHSIGSHVILLNNDTKILPEWGKNAWIDILYKPFLEDDKMGITGPMKTFSESAGQEFLIFFCVMISRKVIDAIGLLDESFFSYGEDTSYCIEAQKVGFKIKQVPVESNEYYEDNRMKGNFPIWHAGNISHKNWPGGEELIAKNNAILRERYNKNKIELGGQGVPIMEENMLRVDSVGNVAEDKVGDFIKIPTGGINLERAKRCDGFMSDRELLYLAMKARSSKVFFELGVWHGKSSRAIADNLPIDGKLYCIDHWKGSEKERQTHHVSASWNDGDHAYIEFCENLFDHIQSGKVIPLRMSGNNAAEFLKKQNIKADCVFIDGAHDYDSVKEDIFNWLPLVKEGGILCGHDYIEGSDFLQVKPAVDNIFGTDFKVAEKTMIWYKEIKSDVKLGTPKLEEKKEWWIDKVEKEYIKKSETKLSKIMYASDLLTCQNDVVHYNVFDCFIFNNELDLLEKRLEGLYYFTHRHVIVEATITHSGQKKELVFHNNLHRFEKYLHKITYLVIEENEFPVLGEGATITDWSWSRETFQRNYIMKGLQDCQDNDVVIISDCDEIPTGAKVTEFRPKDGIKSFSMDLFYYDENTKAADKWNEAKICTYKILKEKSPCGVRYTNAPLIENGGRHLSYQGGVEKIIQKISDTAHVEYSNDYFKNPERIKKVIEEGSDLFDRPNIKFERL